MADSLALGRVQELPPEILKLVVRHCGESGVGQRPVADPGRLLKIPEFYVPAVKVEQIEEGVLVQLVLDVVLDHVVEQPLGLLVETQGVE